jgi:GTP cyclohydrolase IA
MNQEYIENLFREILTAGLGLNIKDPNLTDTPKRVAKMYCQEFFSSIGKDRKELDSIATLCPNDHHFDEMVGRDNIPFISMCSHHFIPFYGKASFRYIPDKYLLGASKISRIIDFFARKPQLQENLTSEVMNYVVERVKPKGAMLIMRAVHGCISCRGVRDGEESDMITSSVYGNFKEGNLTRLEGIGTIIWK